MTFGRGYEGGRTRMGTKVILNVYDLSPANDYLYDLGFGLHHSGVEILGTEYSFASGGGIFESSPKEAPGAKYRESIDMGTFDGGQAELRMVVSDLRSDFGPDSYNLIRKNCNHFANALVWALLGRQIPAYVNRLADFGVCCSCLLPKQMLEESPVGPNGGPRGSGSTGGGSGFQVYPSGGRSLPSSSGRAAKPPPPKAAFTGSGAKLGSTSSNNNNSNSTSGGGGGASGIGGRLFGIVGGGSGGGSDGGSGRNGRDDDLTDRREKARKAALARLERQAQDNGGSASGDLETAPLVRDGGGSSGPMTKTGGGGGLKSS